ncbi:TonB-dependent receptor [Niveispirillum sp. BGYR6]|uniref:TonB-dependent siderophore receptor n=1 Tax=Niveispirillum sp. BGYR6 TaxID=2971249 RepID=UPI0022B9D425|nr:TonB-dependent receptor [Niveispirillum sp. BGYR6]MDG5496239.1 TonB-dependent receptor [Niveispirillum sp. BGYR6]
MFSFRKASLRGAVAMIALAGTVSPVAGAEGVAAAPMTEFDIPASSLGAAIARLGRQAGVMVTVDPALVRNLRTEGLRGRYSVADALDRLLAGSDRQARIDGTGGFIIAARGNVASSIPETDTEIVVIGTPESRYVSRTPQAGSRIEKDILDTPRSVDAIPEQVLRDQHIRELSEIYRYSANVVNNDGYGGTREDYIIRGFRRRDDVYRDGVRLKTNSIVDPSTVASVEILKGPTSDIGQMTPGGLVNIITKKPQLQEYRRIELNTGNQGERQAYADITGGFAGDRFAYRLTGSYENGHTFRNDSKTKRSFANGSLSWFGDSGATANLTYEHGDDDRPMDRGSITLPVSGSLREVPSLPRSQRLDAPFARRDSSYDLASADLAIPVAPDWQMEAKLLSNTEKTDEVHTEVRSIASNGTLVRRVEGNDDRDLETRFGRLQMRGQGELGLPYKLVAGVEYRRQTESWINYVGANQSFGTAFNPQSEKLVNDGASPVQRTQRTQRSVKQEDWGPYVQADIQLAEPLTLTLGARREAYKGNFANQVIVGSGGRTAFSYPTSYKFTKSGALAYKPEESWTLYANYSDTFQPQNFYENSTQVFPAQEGRMYEAGAKKALFGNRLLLTAAYFDIKQSNLVEVSNGVPFLSGGQTSRGVEMAVIGSPMRGLNVRAGVGHADAEVVSRDTATDGKLPTNVPRWNANAYVSYEIKDEDSPLRGLGLGLGAIYVSKRYGDIQHSFSIGDYLVADATAWYYLPLGTGRQVRLTGGVKNLWDERYYTASGGTYRIAVGAPRTVFVGLAAEF